MNIKIVSQIGFCSGVNNSLRIINEALKANNKELYLIGMVVHNELVNNDLKRKGIKFLNKESLSNLDHQKTIITTAHGTRDDVIAYFKSKGVKIIDTTCPIVKQNTIKIQRYLNDGFDCIYIGIKNHPESDVVKDDVHLIENKQDIDNLNISNNRIVLVNQTTMTSDDLDVLTKAVIKKYPSCLISTSICPATIKRQNEVLDSVKLNHSPLDFWLVLGGKMSNNTKKLKEIIKQYTNNVFLISSIDDLYAINLKASYNVFITSGTSTPTAFVDDVVEFLNVTFNKK